eukprot:12149732-Alexandrium_andersonii.AAC.1
MRWFLFGGDCKNAFLQGAPDTDQRPRAVYMRSPADPVARGAIPEWSLGPRLYQLITAVYGMAHAPRQ